MKSHLVKNEEKSTHSRVMKEHAPRIYTTEEKYARAREDFRNIHHVLSFDHL